MKKIFCLILASLIFTSNNISQDYNYWASATAGERIYTILFFEDAKIFSVSAEDEFFSSNNNGVTWELMGTKNISEIKNAGLQWRADIHCAVLHTTDGGNYWSPYSSQKQEHFCRVYLKDPNVGYQTAFEFLTRVTSELNSRLKDSSDEALNFPPQQCTEYYTNEDEGWALGWCVKNFEIKSSIKNSEK